MRLKGNRYFQTRFFYLYTVSLRQHTTLRNAFFSISWLKVRCAMNETFFSSVGVKGGCLTRKKGIFIIFTTLRYFFCWNRKYTEAT